MIQYSLQDRLLLDLAQELMLADPPPARLGHQCLSSARRLLRPRRVHRLERDLEHRRNILASPARDQRGHCP
ncbi:hypothetical protein [Streptomyces sp. HD]|uniref:hypothetical protein n=1 Tax=Streptomyces sp. HD TaxID=3020892 RepID=UPI003FA7D4DB